MCGIMGGTGKLPILPLLTEGLRRLEYRGYDSAGLAIHGKRGLVVHKAQGNVRDLLARLPRQVPGTTGIGHTRWATHGAPSDANAHPHLDPTGRIAIVHNGVLDGAAQLRVRLAADGAVFASETDSEVLAHLIAREPAATLIDAVRAVLRGLTGTWGLAVLDTRHPGEVVVARNGSPLVLGIADGAMLVASDPAALLPHTDRVVFLADGDVAALTPAGYTVTDLHAAPSAATPERLDRTAAVADLAGHTHWMHKEICEQPDAIAATLRGRLDERFATARLDGLELSPADLLGIRRIRLVGCGSAYIAALLGARLIEQVARIPCDAETAAEFRYRNPIIEADTLYLAISQSGETFDTLAAVEEIRRRGGRVRGIVNCVGSTIARACGGGIYLHAGPETAVVSSKSFTCTAVALLLLGLHLGRMRDLSPADGARLIAGLHALPEVFARQLATEPAIADHAALFSEARNAFYIGRADGYPLALEGALKLKEVSYLHAEAYPAAELKHGPLAMIDPETPTVALLPDDEWHARNLGSIAQVAARGGPVLAIAQGVASDGATARIDVPATHPRLATLAMLVPMQLLAYHVALARGCNVDQPRNLAKSVTVE